MKKIINIAFSSIIILLAACSKDLGNYDYTKINDLQITDGVLPGDHNTNRIYNVSFGDVLNVSPTIEGSISGNDLSQVEFLWTIDDKVVSKTKDLLYTANDKYGKLNGVLKITDKSTSIVKTYAFFVEVMNGFKAGYYFLTENNNNDASMHCIPTSSPDFGLKQINIPRIGDFGKNPFYLGGYLRYGNSSSDYWNIIFLGVKDAKYPVSVIESKEFFPFRLYDNTSYLGEGTLDFNPKQMWHDPGTSNDVMHGVINGKLHVFSRGAASEAKFTKDPDNYNIGPNGLFKMHNSSTLEQFIAFFDDANRRIRLISAGSNVPFNFNVEHNVPQASELFTGHDFLFGTYYNNSPNIVYTFITKKDNQLNLFEGTINATTRLPGALVKIGTADIPENNPVSRISFNSSQLSYYVGIGKTLYRFQNKAIDNVINLEEYIKLPSDAPGNISDFIFGNVSIGIRATNYNSLVITTTDMSFSSDNKSSIYIYNTQNLTLSNAQKHVLGSVKGIYVGL
ncbi:PKD-like family lipoprotein [Sphingobacterium bovistauri]|uniref:PKD-like family protein n=1 Tax=Sphingobacterium bovistauri TaxID=2781959 RepID=A0ABS7ZCY4_9SPHI|nr:PKD-like family lipoprotein [Sphingobacterium bovistauri]MCA5006745.1 hypothetical protein [Sphingobacterium bovistauri]